MLNRLTIRNYAIIEQLDLRLEPGLTIITGETGAGKSILLGALGLALGRRGDARVLPDGADKCVVEAHFSLPDESLRAQHESAGVDFEPVMICRREIASGGRSRSFINDTPVTLKAMQELTSACIELHHQHDNLALQSRAYQLDLLDTIGHATSAREAYVTHYKALQQARHALEEARELEKQSLRRRDFLQFQLEELSGAKLQAGEVARLESTQSLLEHAEAIASTLGSLESMLQMGPHAILDQLNQALRQAAQVAPYYSGIAEIATRLESLRIEVQDIAMEVARLDVPGGSDPNELGRVQQRLNQLYALLKKYQCRDDGDLVNQHKTLQAEFDQIESIAETIEQLQHQVLEQTSMVQESGALLTARREKGTRELTPKILALLKELGMPNARLEISITALDAPGPAGLDEVQFLFSANRGAALQPIQQVASGGELSRLSLALKSVYAGQAGVDTIIFDEIDTGISGEVAWRMGQLIRNLSSGHQILMVTHSPQIAAHALHHFHVSKLARDDRDISDMRQLSSKDRIIEIAKMLSGDPPSKKALANAEDLIGQVVPTA